MRHCRERSRSNSANGPTTTIRRVQGGQGQVLLGSGAWVQPGTQDPNNSHIPLTGSPY